MDGPKAQMNRRLRQLRGLIEAALRAERRRAPPKEEPLRISREALVEEVTWARLMGARMALKWLAGRGALDAVGLKKVLGARR